MDIENRVFGSDFADEIKNKLRRRQALNQSADFGEPIQSMTNWDEYTSDFKEEDRALADLSSRTPFVRMWVALETYILGETTPCKPVLNLEGGIATDVGTVPNNGATEDCIDDDAHAIFKTANGYWHREIESGHGISTQIYQIGNHTLNMLKNTEVNESIPSIDDEGRLREELASNPFFKPQTGILSFSSETKNVTASGIPGLVKESTVNFVVNNFQDFEKIYRPYFLRPGASVFVDYGWNISDLYDPEKLDFRSGNIENELMGSVAKSAGDLDIIMGRVTSYDAKIKENGSVECSIKLKSMNSALIEAKLTASAIEKLNEKIDAEQTDDYIKWADFEDKVLNPLYGFAGSPDDKDENSNGAKFNSSGSYMGYYPELTKPESTAPLQPFKYPETWATKEEDISVEHARIPVREMLVKTNVVLVGTEENSTTSGNSINNYVTDVLDRISKSNENIVTLVTYSNSYAQSSISVCDEKYLPDIDSGDEDVFKNLFVFHPGSPNSIVKTYDLSFTLPKGALQNIQAIESQGAYAGFFPVDDRMDQLLASSQANKSSAENYENTYVKYLPDPSHIPENITAGEAKTGELQRLKQTAFTERQSPRTILNLSLSIYGISALAPGDLFKVDYLPGYLLGNTFFQIMRISHDVSPSTWTTKIDTVQRYLYKEKQLPSSTVWKSSDSIPDGDENEGDNSQDGEISIKITHADLTKRLQRIGIIIIEDDMLTEEYVKKAEADYEKKNEPSGISIKSLGKCKGTDVYPKFKNRLNKTGVFEKDANVGSEGFHYIDRYNQYNSTYGITELTNAMYDCDIEIAGKASVGCDLETGLKQAGSNDIACMFKGYGHNKRIERLWEEAIPSGSTAEKANYREQIGTYTIAGKNRSSGTPGLVYGVAEIKQGGTYYMITNSSTTRNSRFTIVPKWDGFNPKDLDFDIDQKRHQNKEGKCDYGWEMNYECQGSFQYSEWGEDVPEEVINEDKNEAIVDKTVNTKVPRWANFSKNWDDYYRKYYWAEENHEYGMLAWSSATYDTHNYFIDCNSNSACYLQVFAATKKTGMMRAIDVVNGLPTKHMLRGGVNEYASISGMKDGVAIVKTEPYCVDQKVMKSDGVNTMTIQPTFDTAPRGTHWDGIPGSDGTREFFKEFCEYFDENGITPPQ